MAKEQRQPPQEGFGFTSNEKLFTRVTDERFRALLFASQTTIHSITLAGNNYGEFLFVTASRETAEGRECITFWGLGLHEYREKWLTKEWRWHRANQFPQTMSQKLPREAAEQLLREREAEIAPHVDSTTQSKQGQLFEMLTDLTDEDGAYSEMEDLGNLLHGLWDEE